MISKVLSSIEGIAAYPLVSLMIFILFFLIVTLWILRLDKQYLQYMSKLPLDQTNEDMADRNQTL